jgi:outer membrane protein OmpA-like peptidoglycan-associated protein
MPHVNYHQPAGSDALPAGICRTKTGGTLSRTNTLKCLCLILLPCVIFAFPAVDGGRGLFRVQDARSEGYGWLVVKGNLVYRTMGPEQQQLIDAPFGASYAFTDWLEITAMTGYAGWGDTLGSVRPSDLSFGWTDARVGLKACATSWLPVFKLGGAFYHQFGTRGYTAQAVRDYPLPIRDYSEWRGMATFAFKDLLPNVPLSLTANYGSTFGPGGRFAVAEPDASWSLSGLGVDLSTGTLQLYGEFTGQNSAPGFPLLASDATVRKHLTVGGRVRLGFANLGLDIDRGLTDNVPRWTYSLGISFVSPVGRPPAKPVGIVAGTIVDYRTGAPLAASIRVPGVKAYKDKVVTAFTNGAYKLEKVPANQPIVLEVELPEYQPQTVTVTVKDQETFVQDIKLHTIKQFGTVTGTVTDAATYRPLVAMVRSPGGTTAEVMSDSVTGVFTLSDVPVGPLPLEVTAEGYQSTAASVTVRDNEVTTENFALRPLRVFGSITGRVLDVNTKAPLPAGIIFPESTGLAALASDPATGVFNGERIPTGTHTLTAQVEGYIAEARPVVIEENKVTSVEFLLRPGKEFGSLSGMVTDAADGKPVSAQVSVADSTVPPVSSDVNAGGFYKLDKVPTGVTVVKAVAEGYFTAQASVMIETGKPAQADFRLTPAVQNGQLTGMVTDKASKAPLRAFVYFPNSATASVESDSGTGFYKAEVPVGATVVACSLPGYARQIATSPVIIKKGEPAIYNFELLKIGTEITLRADAIHFAFNSAEIQPAGYPALNDWVKLMKDNPFMTAEIQGHTDAVGSESYNQDLSERRAGSVVNYLVSQGVERGRLTPMGYGESRLAVQTQEKSEENRRVVFKVTGEVKKP